MSAVIETSGLTKYYGNVRGAEDVDLKVSAGEVFGFLGPNGAGKSTTIRMLLDFIRPTRGRAWVVGWTRERTRSRSTNGWVPTRRAVDVRKDDRAGDAEILCLTA